MLTLLRYIFGIDAVFPENGDAAELRAAAAGARARLEQQGLLQVELDAQAEIKQRVREARMTRERAGSALERGEKERSRAAA